MIRLTSAILGLALLAAPVWAQQIEKFPKAAPPDPLPETQCDGAVTPATWGLGQWHSKSAKLMVEKGRWHLDSDEGEFSGTAVELTDCAVRLTSSKDGKAVFEGVRDLDNQLYGVLTIGDDRPSRYVMIRGK